jgi:hypothetical protein
MKRIALTFLIAVGLLMWGCSAGSRLGKLQAEPKSVAELSRAYLGDVRWRLPERNAEDYAYLVDRPNFLRLHRYEMLKTLEVVETAETCKCCSRFRALLDWNDCLQGRGVDEEN